MNGSIERSSLKRDEPLSITIVPNARIEFNLTGSLATSGGQVRMGEQERCRAMRILVFIVLILAALWAGDMYFYKGRYTNAIWSGLGQKAQKFNYEVRRLMRF